MINDQEYITTELKQVLEKMLILKSTRLNNLVAVIIGIIVSRSVILSNISQELKDCYSRGNEESKIKMMYLCISIAYCWIITLGTSCSKDKKNKLIGAVKLLKGKKVRIYSLFRAGYKWFKRCYYSNRSEYYLKITFTLYES